MTDAELEAIEARMNDWKGCYNFKNRDVRALLDEVKRLRAEIAELNGELAIKDRAIHENLQCHIEQFEALREQMGRDTARLDWISRHVTGAEWRKIGVEYASMDFMREAIDAAMEAEA